jgi:hypothetical protein
MRAMRRDSARRRARAGGDAGKGARASALPYTFALAALAAHASAAPRDCAFTTPAGDFDLAPLGAVRIVSSKTASFGWTYLFSACANVDASTAAGHCSGMSPAVQATSGACYSLGSLAQRSVAPLAANSDGRIGVTVALEGGDSCGGGVTRTISIDVVCADVTRASKASVLESTTRICVYNAAVESRAGCPLACAREPATGAVCGGKLRGACLANASGAATCVCLSGHAGPLCAAKTTEPAHSSSFALSVATLVGVVAGMAVAGMLAAIAGKCCCQTSAASAPSVGAVPFFRMPRMLSAYKMCVLVKGGLMPLNAFVAAALMLLTLMVLVAPGGSKDSPPLRLKQTTVAVADPVTGAGLLVFCVTGSYANFFLHTLASLERFAPDAFVAVMADTRVEDELKRSLTTAPTNVRVRIYRFQALFEAANTSSNGIMVDRYAVLPLILNDFADGIKQEPSASGFVAWESDSFSQTAASSKVAFAGMFDTRDLVFQGDPFQPLREAVTGLSPSIQGVLTLALESQHIPIGSCPLNRKMVSEAFGSDAARAVATFRICNGGGLIGSILSLRDFVNSVLNPAIFWSVATADSTGKFVQKPNLDQGALTFVGPAMIAAASLHSTNRGAGRLAAFTALSGPKDVISRALQFAARNKILEASAEGSWICTIGYFPAINVEPVLDSEGYLMSLWEPEERCRVVHQFDRFPHLNEHFTRIFERK